MFTFRDILLMNVMPAVVGAIALRGFYESRGLDKKKWSIIGGILGLITSIFGLIIVYLLHLRKPVRSRYPRTRGGPEEFEMICHWGTFRVILVEVLYRGHSIGKIDLKKQVRKKRSLRMPDGTVVEVQLEQKLFTSRENPYLSIDGKALPGSVVDPYKIIDDAGKAFLFGSGYSFFIGLDWISTNHFMALIEFGYGYIFLIIAVLLFRTKIMGAVLGTIFLLINIGNYLYMLFGDGSMFFDLIGDAIFIFGLVNAYRGLSKLKKEK